MSKRVFSNNNTSPLVRLLAASSASVPMIVSIFLTEVPRSSSNGLTTGFNRPFLPVSMISPLGRPKWLIKTTLAPLSSKNLVVGTIARNRVSSVTVTSSLARGTFKSTRTKTFFPSRSTFSASPSTFNFSQHDEEAWKFLRNAAAVLVLRVRNFVATVENIVIICCCLRLFHNEFSGEKMILWLEITRQEPRETSELFSRSAV
mmetsp:Transcript_13814/g.32263  ORF Transcript_13814/g.32263 Transcript_13814/m.32263 type:complete len:203 (-) Transcript_13814:123-731(-)